MSAFESEAYTQIVYVGHVRARRSTISNAIIAIVVVVVVVLGCGGIDDDELSCEEAISHLEDCCPGFDAHRFNCKSQSDCLGAINPDLTLTASRCIRDVECSTARAPSGVCDRMIALSASPYPFQERAQLEQAACK